MLKKRSVVQMLGGEVFVWISGERCGCRALEQIMAERDE